jgi:hypothetical protein
LNIFVKYLPSKAWKTFRKCQRGDEHEVVKFNKKEKSFWVEEESPVKHYTDRPTATEPLSILQKGLQYR